MTASVTSRGVERWQAVPRLLRFLVVGGVNTLFGYGAYALFVVIGLHYAMAALLGTIAGVLFNFFTTGRLVFDRLSAADLWRFVAVYGIVYLLNVGALALLARLGIGPYAGGLACIVPMALVSFVLQRRFVFVDRSCR